MTDQKQSNHKETTLSPASFDDIYQTHAPTIYRLGWAMLRHHQGAEDVVQETFLRAYKARDRFDPTRASLGTWLYQIALNYCRSYLRRQRFLTLPWFKTTVEPTQPTSPTNNIETNLLKSETQQTLWRGVEGLSAPLKEVIILHYYLEIPAVEIATILNCPEGTIYSRLYNARKRLAKQLQQDGLTASDILEIEHVR